MRHTVRDIAVSALGFSTALTLLFATQGAQASDVPLSMLSGGVVASTGAAASPEDAHWDASFPYPGTNGPVTALAVDTSGNLYVGGEFTTVGGISAPRVGKWNGTTWSALGSGLNGVVDAVAVDAIGNVYVGGEFTTAGGVSALRIAKWNGTTWTALGLGLNGRVHSLDVDASGNLYVGGEFTTAGGISAPRIAKWNGSSWSSLGTPRELVSAIAVDASGNVYAVGGGSSIAPYVIMWNGTDWIDVGPAIDGYYAFALACDLSGNLYVGGLFNYCGDVLTYNIAKWNGVTWSALGSGMADAVFDLAVDGSGNLYAVTWSGDFSSIEQWNGLTWTTLNFGTGGTVNALVVDEIGNVYAGGDFASAGSASAFRVAKWNQMYWSALGLGMNSSVYAIASAANGDIYAGGVFTAAGSASASRVARLRSGAWSKLGSHWTFDQGAVYALATDEYGNLYAGGYCPNSSWTWTPYVNKWNGVSWTQLTTGFQNSPNFQVKALAVDGDGNLFAGGYFSNVGAVQLHNIAKWNGTTWSRLGTGLINQPVSALAIDSSGILYAGTSSGVVRWDGVNWSTLGSGIDGEVYALALDASGNLYAGGTFMEAGGIPVNSIAKWDGTTWSRLGTGLIAGHYPVVRALHVDESGNLYAGGSFHIAGSLPAYYIAKWDGTTWSALGSGLSYDVHALAGNEIGDLYVGGSFGLAGEKASSFFAIWHGPLPVSVYPDPQPQSWVTLHDIAPNPFNPLTTLRFDITEAGHVRLVIYDIRGKLVRTVLDTNIPRGSHQAVWDGKDDCGNSAASGIYFARIDVGSTHETRKMTLVK